MNCPKCGKRVSVTNTRTADSANYQRNQRLLQTAEGLVGWYTQDWVARVRVCKNCPWTSMTVEIPVDDWKEMRKIVEEEAKKKTNRDGKRGG